MPPAFIKEVVDYCLNAEGIKLDDVDLVVRNCYIMPVEEMERRLAYQDMPAFLNPIRASSSGRHPLFLSRSDKVVTISHHLAHAYSAFAACPFDEGVVMVVDGVGSYSADVTEQYPPSDKASIRWRASRRAITAFDGSETRNTEKGLDGADPRLAQRRILQHGGPRRALQPCLDLCVRRLEQVRRVDGAGALRTPGPNEAADGNQGRRADSSAGLDRDEFKQPYLLDSGREVGRQSLDAHWEDLAWQVQDDTERVLLARARWLRETTGAKNLCLAGGVALNCVANGRIAREAGFDNVWIQPAAGDDGIAIGCAYYGHLAIQKKPRSFVMNHAFSASHYKDEDVRARRRAAARPACRRRNAPSTDICRDTAKVLSEGDVIGWFQGRSEFGPRALGNRSIIADPRTPGMKDHPQQRGSSTGSRSGRLRRSFSPSGRRRFSRATRSRPSC